MAFGKSAMQEPVAIMKTMLTQLKLLTNKLLSQDYRKALVSALIRSTGDIMTSLIPTMWPLSDYFLFDGHSRHIV